MRNENVAFVLCCPLWFLRVIFSKTNKINLDRVGDSNQRLQSEKRERYLRDMPPRRFFIFLVLALSALTPNKF